LTLYNWDKVPEHFKWVARNYDGRIYAFKERPDLYTNTKQWLVSGNGCELMGSVAFVLNDVVLCDWTTSLEERPKPKPRYIHWKNDSPLDRIILFDTQDRENITIKDILDHYNREHQ
jgi:hypothetical protein